MVAILSRLVGFSRAETATWATCVILVLGLSGLDVRLVSFTIRVSKRFSFGLGEVQAMECNFL